MLNSWWRVPFIRNILLVNCNQNAQFPKNFFPKWLWPIQMLTCIPQTLTSVSNWSLHNYTIKWYMLYSHRVWNSESISWILIDSVKNWFVLDKYNFSSFLRDENFFFTKQRWRQEITLSCLLYLQKSDKSICVLRLFEGKKTFFIRS